MFFIDLQMHMSDSQKNELQLETCKINQCKQVRIEWPTTVDVETKFTPALVNGDIKEMEKCT